MTISNSGTPDQRENNDTEDSTAMTIEYLRARLLSERSVSRAARLRSEELTKRVVQLEEQLKIVTSQRKRAEKATEEVLAILENHGGMSDVSEAIDSSSDEEEMCESNNGSDITNGQECSTSIRDRGVNSGSEVESSPSIGRSLSWKSGRSSQNSSRLKHSDSSRRGYASFAPKNSSTNRMGKSCRRNRRQEISSTVEVSPNSSMIFQNDVSTACSKDVPNCSKFLLHDSGATLEESQIADGHFLSENGGYQDVEGAVHNQEQLIGRNEAEEIAQRNWEEKFRENNTCSPDSLDLANNSNVSEERDDVKSTGKPCSAAAIIDPDVEKDSGTAHDSSKPEAGTSSSGNYGQGRSGHSNVDDSSSGNKSPGALVPNRPTNDVGSILEALEQAKLSLKQKLEVQPMSREGRVSERMMNPFASVIRPRVEIPGIGCHSLFRLPTDVQFQAISSPGSSGSNMTDLYPRIYSNEYFSKPRTLANDQRQFSSVSSPANFAIKSSADAGLSSSTKFADLDLPFTTYPFKASRDADLPSSSAFANLDLHGNTLLPFARRVTHPEDRFSPEITPRLPFDVTKLPSLHKNNNMLHSAFDLSSNDVSQSLPPKARLSIYDDRRFRDHPTAHLPSNDQSKKNLHM